MIFFYWHRDRVAALALLSMLVVSCILQIVVAFVQHGKRPKDFIFAVFTIITGTKVGFDAYRVASAATTAEHHTFDPKFQLVITKAIEMFSEGIPGCVLRELHPHVPAPSL